MLGCGQVDPRRTMRSQHAADGRRRREIVASRDAQRSGRLGASPFHNAGSPLRRILASKGPPRCFWDLPPLGGGREVSPHFPCPKGDIICCHVVTLFFINIFIYIYIASLYGFPPNQGRSPKRHVATLFEKHPISWQRDIMTRQNDVTLFSGQFLVRQFLEPSAGHTRRLPNRVKGPVSDHPTSFPALGVIGSPFNVSIE